MVQGGATVKTTTQDIADLAGGGTWSHPSTNPYEYANGAEVSVTHPTITYHDLVVTVVEYVSTPGAKINADHTDYTASTGTVSVSSNVNGTNVGWRTVQAEGASYAWSPVSAEAVGSWWKYALVDAAIVDSYMMKSEGIYGPTEWVVEGSNDGASWVTLDTRTGINTWAGDEKTYAIASPASFTQYRITFNALQNAAGLAMLKVWLYRVGSETEEIVAHGTYASDADIGVQRVDATHTKIRNQSGATKTLSIGVLT